jgi:phage virion morphogenesis protein
MTKLTFKIDDTEVNAALKALAERSQNMPAVLKVIGAGMQERIKRRFETSTGPDGVKWEENKPATKRAKGGKKTLIDRGYLMQQITATVSGNELTVSTNGVTAAYAAIQQFGGTIDRKGGSIKVRHRTNAKGDLLRSAIMNGKGLIFAKQGNKGHKRFIEREFSFGAYKITIPARPYLPVRPDGTLYPQEQADVMEALNEYLMLRT